MPPKLGIVAGGGVLPACLARRATRQGREVFVLALENHAAGEAIGGFPHAWVRLGAAGRALALLREAGVEEVVLAGSVRRPSLAELRPDARAAALLAIGALRRGDDGLLRTVIEALEGEGFRVLGAQDIAGGLLARGGSLGRHRPGAEARADIARGVEVLAALGRVDIGQAVAVQAGVVLAVEAAEGTDALIDRAAGLGRRGPGPVLVKMAKPGQENRADLPAIGPATLRALAGGGFAGVAVEAGGCLLLERDEIVRLADRAELFVEGWPRPGAEP